jgi:hypothetical protein
MSSMPIGRLPGDNRRDWREVTRAKPCPACGKDHWCAWTQDGNRLKCEYSVVPPPGMIRLGLSDNGALFGWKGTKSDRRARGHARAVTGAPSAVYPSAEAAIAVLERTHGKSSCRWPYTDVTGEPSMYVVRFERARAVVGGSSGAESIKPDKTFRPVSRHGDGWCIGFPQGPRPLYRLPEVLAAPKAQFVYVAEGEKSADAARRLGLVCTTSPQGCSGASKADWSPLHGRHAVVFPDFDAPGESYARRVAEEATSAGAASVRVVRLWERWPDLAAGGDIADLVARLDPDDQAKKDELKREIEALAEEASVELITLPRTRSDDQDERLTVPERVVQFALERFRLIRDPGGELFAVPKDGPNIAIGMTGKEPPFRDHLAREWRRDTGRAVGTTALSDALATLRGEASDAPCEKVHIRTAPYKDGVVLDLGTRDGAAVVVSPTGWTIEPVSPVVFRRTALIGELPRPERGGSLEPLRDLVNVDNETWWLYVGWIVAALLPEIPHPILLVGGHHGTGKTTAARFACDLVDPSGASFRNQPKDVETWAVVASSAWTTLVDNVSTIPEWWSNALCKAVTGDALVRRALFSNSDVCVLSFKRPVAITSIDAGSLRGDLGERLVLVDARAIDASHRRSETALNRAFALAHPALLGAVLDILVGVLARLGKVCVPSCPRMADFAEVLAAMDDLRGTDSLQRYLEQAKWIADEVIESDPVGTAIVDFVRSIGDWCGTMGELLQTIAPARRDREWPSNARGLGARIKSLIPSLEQQGVRVVPPTRSDKTRRYRLEWTAQTARPPENPSGDAAGGGEDRAVIPSSVPDRPSHRPATERSGEAVGRALYMDGSAADGRAVGPSPACDRPSDRPIEIGSGDAGTQALGGRAVRAVDSELHGGAGVVGAALFNDQRGLDPPGAGDSRADPPAMERPGPEGGGGV